MSRYNNTAREARALRDRLNPESQLNRFAELIADPQGGVWLTPQEAAVRMGLDPHRGNALMQRLRKAMGDRQAR